MVAQDHGGVGAQHVLRLRQRGQFRVRAVKSVQPGQRSAGVNEQILQTLCAIFTPGGAQAQASPKQGEVHALRRQQLQRAGVQRGERGVGCREPELARHGQIEGVGVGRFEGFQHRHRGVVVVNEGQQGLAQAKQIPVHHARLAVEGVAALGVGVVANVRWIKCVQKLERTVVQRQAQDAHVVGIQNPVAKAHRLPQRHQLRAALRHRAQQRQIGRLRRR